MTKSAALGLLLRRLGLCTLALHARRRGWLGQDALTILGYHRVGDPPGGGIAAPDDNYSCTAADFEREAALLTRFFTPVTFADLKRAREDEQPLPPNPLILTFDDGYRDNAEVAAPVLRRHGLSACFFLTTGFLDGTACPWWDAINTAMRRAPAGPVRLATLDGLVLELDGPASRARAAAELRGRFRFLAPERYAPVLAELGERAGCDLSPAAFRDQFMTWEQAAALAAEGFEIGAHTRTHPVLSQLENDAVLDDELRGGRDELEARLDVPVIALAYPVGGSAAVSDAVVAHARRAGFAFACTMQDGQNHLRQLDALALRRIAVGADADFAHFTTKMAFPWLFRRSAA